MSRRVGSKGAAVDSQSGSLQCVFALEACSVLSTILAPPDFSSICVCSHYFAGKISTFVEGSFGTGFSCMRQSLVSRPSSRAENRMKWLGSPVFISLLSSMQLLSGITCVFGRHWWLNLGNVSFVLQVVTPSYLPFSSLHTLSPQWHAFACSWLSEIAACLLCSRAGYGARSESQSSLEFVRTESCSRL